MSEKIIAACGNDCAACPRYIKPPFEKTPEELHNTAVLWHKIGYRDSVVSNAEISCMGCTVENWCRYDIVKCVSENNVENCGQCEKYPCGKIQDCFKVTRSFEPACRAACSDEEFAVMKRAFFEKEENLK